MDNVWLKKVIETETLQGMGHSQSVADQNLGFGWVYYGLARAYRPQHVVCIGSYRGFVPMMFAKAMRDNGVDGVVTFIDPSFVDDFWKDPKLVEAWFAEYDVPNIKHYLNTTQEFMESARINQMGPVDFLFVDGYHSAEQARFDYEAFAPLLAQNSLVFFHDSVTRKTSGIYGSEARYEYSVCDFIDELKSRPEMQVLDFPFQDGLTLVRKVSGPIG